MKRIIVLLTSVLIVHSAFSQKALYLDLIKKSVEKSWRETPALLEQWKKKTRPNILWGYTPRDSGVSGGNSSRFSMNRQQGFMPNAPQSCLRNTAACGRR